MTKKPMMYFISDTHFSHQNESGGILTFERGNKFKTIEEHDSYLVNLFISWAEQWVEGSTLWFLGDFGNPDYLWVFNLLRSKNIEIHFLYGNHDSQINEDELLQYVDYTHKYPVFLSHKLAVSHQPIGMWEDSLNVHGHLHSAILDSQNYINACIHVHNYQPVSIKEINSRFSRLSKYTRKFLQEPYANQYKFTQEKPDCVYDINGRIDLAASRLKLDLINGKVKF